MGKSSLGLQKQILKRDKGANKQAVAIFKG